ncbi:MAG: sigma-E factor negative regulatory protein [Rhodanobacter sp.]
MNATPTDPSRTPLPPTPAAREQSAREALSAAMDDELPAQELRFLLRALDHDAELQHAWTRYELMRDGLRGSLPGTRASSDFSARVSALLTAESVASTPRRRHWLRWSAGGAIAASVAAATLMIGQPAGDPERAVATQAVEANTSTVADADPTHAWAVPSAVPPWLSGNAAGLLSQRASATMPSPLRGTAVLQPSRGAFPSLAGYRTLDNADGSYLLLLDPAQAASIGAPQRSAVGGQ